MASANPLLPLLFPAALEPSVVCQGHALARINKVSGCWIQASFKSPASPVLKTASSNPPQKTEVPTGRYRLVGDRESPRGDPLFLYTYLLSTILVPKLMSPTYSMQRKSVFHFRCI